MGSTQYLRPHEVAAMFKVTVTTLNRWAAKGELPFVRTLGGHRRFHPDDVAALLERITHREAV
jgi:excisionase family DNA binding protein